jgi:hypothetical protein
MTKTIDLSVQTPMTADRFNALLADARRDVYKNLKEGWFEGPWGTCETCQRRITEGEVGYRTRTGFVMHSRCMGGIAAEAPGDNIDQIMEQMKEMFGGSD